ncbi:MAG: DUF1559 family PulG-like putative transporter [Pirellulales bacterium]
MTSPEPEPVALPPSPSRFQFSLRTLLLVFVVLASSLATFGAWGIVLFGLVLGLAIFLNQVESLGSALTTLALAVLCLMCLIGLLLTAVSASSQSSRRAQCANNLKQIAIALLNYEQANGCFPPAYIADKTGKPMHSWRVLILPYMECDSLYKAYNFNEPWNGPNNRKLLTQQPLGYVCPSDPSYTNGAQTNYLAVVGPNAAWPGAKSRDSRSIGLAGGTSRTIMVVETAGSGIAWTEPRDLSVETIGAAGGVGISSVHGRVKGFFYVYDPDCGAYVAMADGAVHYLPPGSLTTENQRKLLQLGAAGDEEIDAFDAATDGRIGLNWPNIAALAVWLLSVGALLTRAVRSRKPLCVPPPPPASPLDVFGTDEGEGDGSRGGG